MKMGQMSKLKIQIEMLLDEAREYEEEEEKQRKLDEEETERVNQLTHCVRLNNVAYCIRPYLHYEIFVTFI